MFVNIKTDRVFAYEGKGRTTFFRSVKINILNTMCVHLYEAPQNIFSPLKAIFTIILE